MGGHRERSVVSILIIVLSRLRIAYCSSIGLALAVCGSLSFTILTGIRQFL